MTKTKNVIDRLLARCRKEPYPRILGIDVLELSTGYARVMMPVEDRMQNIFGMLHGGAVFSLVDEAFQLACNSRGEIAVAQQVTIYYLAAASPDATLIAEAVEENTTRKTALYEVTVYEQGDDATPGRKIASAKALAYRKGGELPFDESGEMTP